jgi:hypothetical protein
MFFILFKKGENKVNNDRRAKRKKGKVDKIEPYSGAFNAYQIAYGITNTKGLLLKPGDYYGYYFFHLNTLTQ